jgi:hypothetical protein
MTLERIDSEVVRETNGFSFSMRVAGTQQTVRVFVSDDALEGGDYAEDDELRAQFDADRPALEALASEKYMLGRSAADGVIAICLSDVVNFIE